MLDKIIEHAIELWRVTFEDVTIDPLDGQFIP